MNFTEAFELTKQGKKVKRRHWAGYWALEMGDIVMHCKDGRIINIRDSEDMQFTITNMLADDWESADTGNCPLLEDKLIHTFTFGEALGQLKQGKRVARKGWNGKEQYIELATNVSYVNSAGEVKNVNHEQMGNKAIAFVGTSGVQLGWLASQADMLSEDWVIIE